MGAHVIDCGACVGVDYVHHVVGDVEFLCYDLGVGVHGTSSVVHQRADVVEGAVLVELQHGAAEVDDASRHGRTCAAGVVAPSHADASPVPACLVLCPWSLVPAYEFGAGLQYLLDAAALDDALDAGPLSPEEVSLSDVVLEPKVQGVDAQLPRQFVH